MSTIIYLIYGSNDSFSNPGLEFQTGPNYGDLPYYWLIWIHQATILTCPSFSKYGACTCDCLPGGPAVVVVDDSVLPPASWYIVQL